jgi:hypothetical protein
MEGMISVLDKRSVPGEFPGKTGLRLAMFSDEFEPARTTIKIDNSDLVAWTVGPGPLLNRLQLKSHGGQQSPPRFIGRSLQQAQKLVAFVGSILDGLDRGLQLVRSIAQQERHWV